jgi:hypothetical protein
VERPDAKASGIFVLMPVTCGILRHVSETNTVVQHARASSAPFVLSDFSVRSVFCLSNLNTENTENGGGRGETRLKILARSGGLASGSRTMRS